MPVLVAITVPMLTVSLFLHPVYAATRTWDGGGTDGTCGGAAGDGNKWSCAANWLDDTVPLAGDAVVFDGTSTKDSTIDASFTGTITSISINSGYTGTITMARSLTMSGTYTQAAGTFAQGAQTLTIAGNFAHTGGTFTANTGTVQLTGTTPTLTGATTFNNLFIQQVTSGNASVTFPASFTTTVQGTARLLAGQTDTSLAVTVISSSSGSAANIDFQGRVVAIAAHIKDISNIGTNEIKCYSACVDNGNNTNIRFGEPGFITTKATGNVSETGTTATFTVALRGKPTASVTVPVSVSEDTEASISPSSLVFTSVNYATPQTITVTGVNDTDDDGGIAASVVLGAAVSTDALYSGLNPSDVDIFTEDNDRVTTTIDFDDATTLTEEDVKGTVAWFDEVDQGTGIFKVSNGGAAVDLAVLKVRAGCRATVGGADYTIGHVSSAVTGQVLLTDGVTSPTQIYLTLVDAAVTKIVCPEKIVDSVRLGGAEMPMTVSTTDLSGVSGFFASNIVDEVHDTVWVSLTSSDELIGVSTVTGLETSRRATPDEPFDMGIDPTRNRLWVASYGGTDKVTAFDAATGDYAFGTLGASSFATGGSTDQPLHVIYNPDLDEIWVGTALHKIFRINPTTGAVIATLETGGTASSSFAYDSIQHAVWATTRTPGLVSLVKFDAYTGSYANGTLAASQYPFPVGSEGGDGFDDMVFDASRNALWVMTNLESDNADRLIKISAATGDILGEYETGPGGAAPGLALDETGGVVYAVSTSLYLGFSGGTGSAIIAFDANTGERLSDNAVNISDFDIAHESNGTFWAINPTDSVLSHLVLGAAPTGKFYTTLTTDTSNVDVSSSTPLHTVSATEDADGGTVSYSISFDGRQSFKVGGTWRTIASSLAADHAGTAGNWYYRNDADTWTAAPANTPAQAISLAVENGPTNNRMTATQLGTISPSDWSGTGGFTSSTASIDLAVTLMADSADEHPAVDNVAFTFASTPSSGGSGGGRAPGATPPAPQPSPEPTPTPEPSFPEGTGLVPGDFARNAGSSTVYYITAEGTKRSFVNAKTFFTYTSDFSTVKFVSNASIDAFASGEPMPPKPGTVLVKTPSSDKVYAFASDATIDHPEIRWIPSESLARSFFGANWADYVIDLDQASLDLLPVGTQMTSADNPDPSPLIRRVDLAKRVSDFLQYATLHMANLVSWAAADSVHFPFWPRFHK